MKKSFHVGFINDQEDIEQLTETMKQHIEKFGTICFCIGKDTQENRDSCIESLCGIGETLAKK